MVNSIYIQTPADIGCLKMCNFYWPSMYFRVSYNGCWAIILTWSRRRRTNNWWQAYYRLKIFTTLKLIYHRSLQVLWHCWLGNRKGIWPVKNWMLVWCWHFDWSFAHLIAPAVTTSIILSSNKIQHGDILVPANPGPPGKWLLKWR